MLQGEKMKIIILLISVSLASVMHFKVTYHDTTKITQYYKNGNIKIKGMKVKNFKDGKWYYYKKDGSIFMVEEYKKGKLIRGIQEKANLTNSNVAAE